MQWILLVQELRPWDQTPGAGASRRQVPLLAPGRWRQGRESDVRRQWRDSCIACFKAGLAAQGKRMGARRGAFPGVIVEPSALVAVLSAHRAVAGLVDGWAGRSRTAC
jgi:hypothetical protein